MMHESLSPLANHLWQSTAFAFAAVALTLVLARNCAQTRYWIWVAASLKFLVPFSFLYAFGNQFESRTASIVAPSVALVAEQISQPFARVSTVSAIALAQPASFPLAPALLLAVWFSGFAVVLAIWWTRWRRIRAVARAASPVHFELPMRSSIPVISSPSLLEPGVFGIFRPVVLLPEGIVHRLTAGQLSAILAHELCHVKRRDNLAAALHMVVEALFWFHPLVWWIGARLVDERERACDEEVLRLGSEPEVYAEGILNVCKFYLESPLPCASGVTGADLKTRIEAIMANRFSPKLTLARKLLVAAAGIAAVAGPILVGVVNAPRSQAQSKDSLAFEVATIKPSDPSEQGVALRFQPGGGANITNFSLKQIMAFAYDVRDFQITGGPAWVGSDKFDIVAKSPSQEAATDFGTMTDEQRRTMHDQMRERLRVLMADRFQLMIHKDTKDQPMYSLVIGENGHKLKESATERPNRNMRSGIGMGQIDGHGMTMDMLTAMLARSMGRPVVDRTGLKGGFDFKLEWNEDPRGPMGPPTDERPEASVADSGGPSIFRAVQEQLGLKLESGRGPAQIIVIDRVEKASSN